MSFRLVGKNCAAQITFGGMQDGAPNYTSAVPVKALAKSISKEDSTNTATFPALGDDRELTQVLRGSTKIMIDLFVTDAGAQFDGKVGHYVKFEYKELTTQTAFKAFEGVVTDYKLDMPDGPTTESITIACDANGGTGV